MKARVKKQIERATAIYRKQISEATVKAYKMEKEITDLKNRNALYVKSTTSEIVTVHAAASVPLFIAYDTPVDMAEVAGRDIASKLVGFILDEHLIKYENKYDPDRNSLVYRGEVKIVKPK